MQKVEEKIQAVFPDTKKLYRHSLSSWAGGDHHADVLVGNKIDCEGHSDSVWSKNGKWRGNDSVHTINVKKSWYRTVYEEKIAEIGGLVTLSAKKITNRTYQTIWIEQGRGFDLKLVQGYIIKGFHVKTNSLQKALKISEKARAKSTRALKMKRISRASLHNIYVQVDDSVAAGNCPSGTKQFKSKILNHFGFGECAIRGDILLDFQNDINTQRAVAYAGTHH